MHGTLQMQALQKEAVLNEFWAAVVNGDFKLAERIRVANLDLFERIAVNSGIAA